MNIKWFSRWPKPAKTFTSKSWGEPSFHTIFKGINWFAQIQFNGELMLVKEEEYLNSILDKLNEVG